MATLRILVCLLYYWPHRTGLTRHVQNLQALADLVDRRNEAPRGRTFVNLVLRARSAAG